MNSRNAKRRGLQVTIHDAPEDSFIADGKEEYHFFPHMIIR